TERRSLTVPIGTSSAAGGCASLSRRARSHWGNFVVHVCDRQRRGGSRGLEQLRCHGSVMQLAGRGEP
ncbi:hypothetical protein BV25DRAFT_1820223, partial [Artomyces pyxidatus]